MNIVVYAHFAGSPKHGMVYGYYFLAREWVRQGHSVTIVSSSFAHPRHRQPRVKSGLYCEEKIDGICYLWIKTPQYNPAKNVGRAVNIALYSLLIYFLRLPLAKPDVVISSSHHTLSIFAAKKLAKKFSARLIFEIRDLWPLSLIEVGGISPHHPFIALLRYAEALSYRSADKVVSLMPYAIDYMIDRGMAREKFVYIPNGYDDRDMPASDELPPILHQQVLKNYRKNNKFLVAYTGNFGEANELESLLIALSICENKDVVLVLVGKGPYLESLKTMVTQLALSDRVSILPFVDKHLVTTLLRDVDLGFVGLKHRSMFRYGISPTKINDYFKAKIPILYAISFKDEAIESSGVIVQCESGDPKSIALALDTMSAVPKGELKSLGEQGYEWALANRAYTTLAKKFLCSIQD